MWTPCSCVVSILIVIEHGTRRAHLAGITGNPDGAWTTQARNFLMDVGQLTTSVKFLLRDRAGQFTGSVDAVFTAEDIRILASPPQAPRANAICEKDHWHLAPGTLRSSLIINEHNLRQVLTGHLQHYNTARPHQALGQLRLTPGHRKSTLPSTGSAGNKSSADSHTNTRSPSDRPTLYKKRAGHRLDRVFGSNNGDTRSEPPD